MNLMHISNQQELQLPFRYVNPISIRGGGQIFPYHKIIKKLLIMPLIICNDMLNPA